MVYAGSEGEAAEKPPCPVISWDMAAIKCQDGVQLFLKDIGSVCGIVWGLGDMSLWERTAGRFRSVRSKQMLCNQ